MVKQQIIKDLKSVLEKLNFPSIDIFLSIPKNPIFGDYSTNLALQLAKQPSAVSYQSSDEIAKKIVFSLQSSVFSKNTLEKVENKDGFINFFVKTEKLAKDLDTVLKSGENFGRSELNKGQRARVEYVSANPTGPLHMGNARGGPLGDVIANVLSAQGYEVIREFLDNDVGEQIKALGATIRAEYHNDLPEENQYKGGYIDDLVKNLGAGMEGKSDEEVGMMAVALLHQEILADCHSMGIKFDLVVHESELRKEAATVLAQLKKIGVLKEKEGALWLAPNDEFLKDRETVVQKSDGGYTYFTADIVYHKIKFDSGADLIIDVFGSNHHGHVPRLQAAVKALGFDPRKLRVVLYQYVRVKRGNDVVKMSKRAGNFITAREVLNEVGVDAFRFYLLRFAPQTHMDFDLELLKEQSSKNPVFYVQYAHARMNNILIKAKKSGGEADYGLLIHPAEINLIKHLLIFPDLVSELASTLQVHNLTEYSISLADLFHKFYETCPVLSAETSGLVTARLALVKSCKIVLANTLNLLGVSAPERM